MSKFIISLNGFIVLDWLVLSYRNLMNNELWGVHYFIAYNCKFAVAGDGGLWVVLGVGGTGLWWRPAE